MTEPSFTDVMGGEVGGASASPVSLAELMALAQKTIDLEKSVADLEQALAVQKEALDLLRFKQLPEAMAAVGQSKFSTTSGAEVKVVQFVRGSLPKEDARRTKALATLIDAGGEALIKNEVRVSFDKKQHNEALALAERIRKAGFDPAVISDVHPQTLMAFVREKLKKGEEVDYETLGCFVSPLAKISFPEAE